MTALRIVSLVLVLTAVLTLGVGTLGFSDASADRSVSAAVVDDDSAYVGYETTEITKINASNDDDIELVTITNRFTEPINVTNVDVGVFGSSNVSIGSVNSPSSIGTGHSSPVTATVNKCSSGAEATVEVTIEVAGDRVSAEVSGDTTDRQFELTCEDS